MDALNIIGLSLNLAGAITLVPDAWRKARPEVNMIGMDTSNPFLQELEKKNWKNYKANWLWKRAWPRIAKAGVLMLVAGFALQLLALLLAG